MTRSTKKLIALAEAWFATRHWQPSLCIGRVAETDSFSFPILEDRVRKMKLALVWE
jgi:hypothetical protein